MPEQTNPQPPTITSLSDLTIIETWDVQNNKPKYTTFYHITKEEVVFFGETTKNKRDMSLAEFTAALRHIKDDETYPEVPNEATLTIAPENMDNSTAFFKRPGLNCYETMKGTPFIPNSLLDETLIMERISNNPHPYLIQYYGCRIRRGRITSIILELLDQTLHQYSSTPQYKQLQKGKFLGALQSAVDHLHSLGLAHNDINPHNIMIKDGMPVLIDFGSCAPFGDRLRSLGTAGWYEELFYTSKKKHDIYSLAKLAEWLENPE